MRSEIKLNHQRLKTTTVYVTHDQIEAMTMADRIVVMHDGVVEQIGTPLELYDRPANLFVAGFIGSPAMNVLGGRIEDGAFVAADDTRIALPAGGAGGGAAHARHPARALPPRPRRGRGRDRHRRADRVGDAGAPALRRRSRWSASSASASASGHGETLRISPDPAHLHLFDAATGRRMAA